MILAKQHLVLELSEQLDDLQSAGDAGNHQVSEKTVILLPRWSGGRLVGGGVSRYEGTS